MIKPSERLKPRMQERRKEAEYRFKRSLLFCVVLLSFLVLTLLLGTITP